MRCYIRQRWRPRLVGGDFCRAPLTSCSRDCTSDHPGAALFGERGVTHRTSSPPKFFTSIAARAQGDAGGDAAPGWSARYRSRRGLESRLSLPTSPAALDKLKVWRVDRAHRETPTCPSRTSMTWKRANVGPLLPPSLSRFDIDELLPEDLCCVTSHFRASEEWRHMLATKKAKVWQATYISRLIDHHLNGRGRRVSTHLVHEGVMNTIRHPHAAALPDGGLYGDEAWRRSVPAYRHVGRWRLNHLDSTTGNNRWLRTRTAEVTAPSAGGRLGNLRLPNRRLDRQGDSVQSGSRVQQGE